MDLWKGWGEWWEKKNFAGSKVNPCVVKSREDEKDEEVLEEMEVLKAIFGDDIVELKEGGPIYRIEIGADEVGE